MPPRLAAWIRHTRLRVWGVRLAALAALAALLAAPTAAAGSSAAVPAALPRSVPAPVAAGTARMLAPHDPAASLRLNVGLRVRNSAQLDALIAAGITLRPAQYTARYAPTNAEAAALSAWLKGRGLKVVGLTQDNLWVKAQGSTQQVAHAFGVSINDYRAGGRTFYANDRAPVVPANLHVSGITGLDNYAVLRTALSTSRRPARSPAVDAGPAMPADGYCPANFSQTYDIHQTAPAQVIGMVLWGAPLVQSDLTAFSSHCGGSLTLGTGADHVQFIAVDGASASTSDWNEVAMDVEQGHGVAPGSQINYYLAVNNSNAAVDDAENAAVHDASSHVVSNSWGSDCDCTDANLNAALQYAASVGTTAYTSSGDHAVLSYPSSSPYVVAVGGTALNTDSAGNWSSETAWSGSGNGCSGVFGRPSWQTGVSAATCPGRATPDVAGDADPNTGSYVYYGGGAHLIGGTSLSAPLWAGLTADWNVALAAKGQPGVGFAAPILYTIAQNPNAACTAQTLHDAITSSPSNTIEHWPGGQVTLGSGGCTVTVARPSGDIDIIGGAGGGDAWRIVSWTGFRTASITVNTPDCEGLGAVGSVTANRPTCTNASTVFENDHSHATADITATAGRSFRDVTSGSAGGHSAGVGWDEVTGWGTPDLTNLISQTPLAQSISFGSIATHTYGNPPFTVTPTATSGLAVTLASNSLGVCTVATNAPNPGWTVTIVGGGTCSLTASQTGNFSYRAAAPVTQTFTVNKATQTIQFPGIANHTLGDPDFGMILAASSGLPVTLASNTASVCTVSPSGQVWVVHLVNAGTCSLTASQAGNGNYLAATPVTQQFSITGPNLVKDGSFELPVGFVTYTAPASIKQWSVTAGSVDVVFYAVGGWAAYSGQQSLDLAGNGPGTIQQPLTLPRTGTYKISYKLAGNPWCGAIKVKLDVLWNGSLAQEKSFDTTGGTPEAPGWVGRSVTVPGTAGPATLTFTSVKPGTCGPALDSISVKQVS